MEKEFIPYEQSVALKELGFNEPCFGAYLGNKLRVFEFSNDLKGYANDANLVIGAPTYSQAFRWFRENHNLRGFIGFRPNTKQFDCHVYDMSLSGEEYIKQRTMEEFNKDPKVGTYEESELDCLIKLIEIVKTK